MDKNLKQNHDEIQTPKKVHYQSQNKGHKLNCFYVLLFLMSLIGTTTLAYIPNSKWLFNKWAENNSAGNVYFEQEVQFQSNGQIYFLKEHWLVDNEGSMKVLVKGSRDLADRIQFQIHYNNNQRTVSPNWMTSKSNTSVDFFEPMFFYKSPQKIIQYLNKQKILTSDISNSKNYQKVDNTFIQTPEEFLRLGRTSGVISIIIGPQPILENKDQKSLGVWIDQDRFYVLKLRGSSLAELNIDKWYSPFKGTHLPKDRNYIWENNFVTMKLGEVKTITPAHRLLFNKIQESYPTDYEGSALKDMINNFYIKFR